MFWKTTLAEYTMLIKIIYFFTLIFILPQSAEAQDPVLFFKQNCVSCHTIGGGRLTGPDLKDVTQRQNREWLKSFIQNPLSKINGGDPYALKLLEEARGVVMPAVVGMTPERAEALLNLIEAESALEKSQFQGPKISNEPFTPADVTRGLNLFNGRLVLKNQGPSCISCHTVARLGGLGGGRLGPDLTRIYERLQGRIGLSAWLYAPATVTMQSVFRNASLESEEIHALVALFENQAQLGEPKASVAQLNYSLLGLGGTVFLLALFDVLWRGRLRSVRRTLVRNRQLRGDL